MGGAAIVHYFPFKILVLQGTVLHVADKQCINNLLTETGKTEMSVAD